jgi:hypothetical protein
MLAAAADLCEVACISAILAAIIVVRVRHGTTTTRMLTLAFISVCHAITLPSWLKTALGKAVETK